MSIEEMRDSILGADDAHIEKVRVPEWNCDVHIKVMSGTDRDAWETEILGGDASVKKNMSAKFLIRCLCDEQGNLIFTQKDIDALGKKSGKALNRLWVRAQKLNRLTLADIDELVKN